MHEGFARQRLDPGGSRSHAFHGQRRIDPAGGAGFVLLFVLLGVRDALFGYVAAVPLAVLGLQLFDRQRATRRGLRELMPPLLALAVATAAVGGGIAEFAVRLSDPARYEHQGLAGHAPIITSIAVDAEVRADGLRVTVPGARWMRQPGGFDLWGSLDTKSDAFVDPDRLYLDVAIQNLDSTHHQVSRAAFSLRARDGRMWAPLADDFPALLVEPEEHLTTRLIFELPRDAAHLDLVWTSGGTEGHFLIADDDVAGLFTSLCRSLATTWRQWSGQARDSAIPGDDAPPRR